MLYIFVRIYFVLVIITFVATKSIAIQGLNFVKVELNLTPSVLLIFTMLLQD
jgi:hypothetical protein